MHWLTCIFGFLALYFAAALVYTLAQGNLGDSHDALLFWGIGMMVFVLAAPINQKLHASRKRDLKEP